MNDELIQQAQQAIAASDADQATKEKAVKLAFEIAVPIALSQSSMSAGGEFLMMLMELIKILLPILLELLKPKPAIA